MAERDRGAAVTAATLRRWRVALVVVGVLILLVGLMVLVTEIPPARYLGIGAWLLGALIVHDGIIAAVVVSVGVLMRRPALRIPYPIALIIQSTLAVGGIITMLVLPEIVKKAIGSANPTLLPTDYSVNLLAVWAVLLTLAVAACAAVLIRRRLIRRRSTRTS